MINKLKICHRLIAPPLISYNRALFSVFEGKNYYQILEVNQSATPDQIKQAFLRLAKVYHPDAQQAKGQKASDSGEAFKKVLEAYNTLSDKRKREDYDSGLKSKSSAGQTNQKTGGFKPGFKGFYRNPNQESQSQQEQTYSAGNNRHQWQDDPYAYERSRAWAQQESDKADDMLWLMKYEWIFFGFQAMKEERRRMVRRGNGPVTEEDLDREDDEAMGLAMAKSDQYSSNRGGRFSNARSKKMLTAEDCKVMTIDQLVEMSKLGYILPSPYKERVIEHEQVYEELPRIAYDTKVERMRKRAAQYSNQENTKKAEPSQSKVESTTSVQNTKAPTENTDNVNSTQEAAPVKAEAGSSVGEGAVKESSNNEEKATTPTSSGKKKQNLRINEILDPMRGIAKSDVLDVSETKVRPQEKSDKKDDGNEGTVGAAQVRVPRMGAGMYSYKKNESF